MTRRVSRREALAGIVAGTSGLAACSGGSPPAGGTPSAGNIAQAPTSFFVALSLQGGYAYVRKASDKTLTIASVANRGPMCDFYDHKMTLIVNTNEVTFDDPGSTFKPTRSGDLLYWELDGASAFVKGMPTAGVQFPAETPWNALVDPYAPKNPYDDAQWNDLVWLPAGGRAAADYDRRIQRWLIVTGGTLNVAAPSNPYGLKGRWVFKDRKKALTDRLRLFYSIVGDGILIRTTGGDISLQPRSGAIFATIRNELNPVNMTFDEGKPLEHFAMLFDAAGDTACRDRLVPTYQKRSDVGQAQQPAEGETPGDLCPPLWLEA